MHDIPEWLEHMPIDADAMGFADIIFPLFMFIMGLSIPMAIDARRRKKESNLKISKHILVRTLALLVMGVFMVNLEYINNEIIPFNKYIWQILMALAFLLIWNTYKRETYWDKIQHWIPRSIGVLILVFLANVYQGGTIKNPIWMQPYWWGILGIIGWAYLLNAFAYLFLGKRLVFIAVLLGILHVLHLSNYIELLSPFSSINFVVGFSNHICVLSGVVATMIYLKYKDKESKKKFLTILFGLGTLFIAYGFLVRPFGGIAKLGGTPSWTDISVGAGFILFALLYMITDIFKQTKWAKVFEPAGRSTLTAYLIPYFFYAITALLSIHLPMFLRAGLIGIIKSLLYSFLIIWITKWFEKAHLRLKI